MLPPGHMGLPFLGETLKFLWYFKVVRQPDNFINSKRQKYGDGEGIYRTHLFGSPAVIACSPVIIKFTFQSSSDFIMEWPAVELIGKSSLVAVQGAAHTRLRSYILRAINQPEALRRFYLMMQPRIISALNSWAQIGRVSSYKQIKKVMFESIGKSFANFEPGSKLDILDDLFTGLMQGIRSYPLDFPGTSYHHALKCRKKAVSIFAEELQKRRKENEDGDTDLMSGLMKLKDDEGKLLSDDEVLDNIVNLVVAGYETTSLTIMWSFYYLAKYPKVLQKLRDENILLSKSKNGELVTSDDISKLKYTNKVVEETIRMANVAATVFRTATRDVEYKGYRIPKGWKVMLWVRYLHTNSENFADPMCFNPDRWNVPAKPGTYQAFGGGSRMCAGNMLARLQVAIFLHYMSTGYKWELVNPEAEMVYLSHPKPADGVEILINKL
jgi:ent-kaurenoic acid hydroxylase